MVRFGLGSDPLLHDETEQVKLIEVAYAKTLDEARSHCAVLQSNSIPAYVEPDVGMPKPCGIAVLIPSDRLIEASAFLTIQAQVEDDDEDDFDDDDDYDDLDDDDDMGLDDDDDDDDMSLGDDDGDLSEEEDDN